MHITDVLIGKKTFKIMNPKNSSKFRRIISSMTYFKCYLFQYL